MAEDTGLVYWLLKASEILGKHAKFVATLVAFVAWVYDLIDRLIGAALSGILDLLHGVDLSSFQKAAFTTVENIGLVNGIIPLSETLTVFQAYFTAWGVVVLIRWIKSFIPTVAN